MSESGNTVGAAVSEVASKVTYTGSAVTAVSGIASFDVGFWVGIGVGVAGLLVNIYYKHQENIRSRKAESRNQVIHDAYLARLQSGMDTRGLRPSEQESQEKAE